MASAARSKPLPAASGKRISQSVICAALASLSPVAIACPASPKPMKAILGLPFPIAILVAAFVAVLSAGSAADIAVDDVRFAV
jgi:hypothetical protein